MKLKQEDLSKFWERGWAVMPHSAPQTSFCMFGLGVQRHSRHSKKISRGWNLAHRATQRTPTTLVRLGLHVPYPSDLLSMLVISNCTSVFYLISKL